MVLHRVLDSMRAVTPRMLVLTGEPSIAALTNGAAVADDLPGEGPLGGIATALRRATEMGLSGALCVAGDMPFLSVPLLRLILVEAGTAPGFIVVPESTGRRGLEPLCAFYPSSAAQAAADALAAGTRAPHALMDEVPTRRVPLWGVRAIGDPEVLFFNLNTPADLERAERIARG
jgi:molybdopterin-guanine dinucleotide biosynthesis protein A